MYLLAELLNRPFVSENTGFDGVYTVWPAAGVDWPDVSVEDRDALRPLYTDEDFAAFDEAGAYLGWSVVFWFDQWVSFMPAF